MAATFDCSVCLLTKTQNKLPKTVDESNICEDCVIEYVVPQFQAALTSEIKYPVSWGTTPLNVSDYEDALGKDFITRYHKREKAYAVPLADRKYCRHAMLVQHNLPSTFDDVKARAMTFSEASVAERLKWASQECGAIVNVAARSGDHLVCESCKGYICPGCFGPLDTDSDPPGDHSCPKPDDVPDKAEENHGLAQGKDFQRCPGPSCGMVVGLRDGCNHVVCPQYDDPRALPHHEDEDLLARPPPTDQEREDAARLHAVLTADVQTNFHLIPGAHPEPIVLHELLNHIKHVEDLIRETRDTGAGDVDFAAIYADWHTHDQAIREILTSLPIPEVQRHLDRLCIALTHCLQTGDDFVSALQDRLLNGIADPMPFLDNDVRARTEQEREWGARRPEMWARELVLYKPLLNDFQVLVLTDTTDRLHTALELMLDVRDNLGEYADLQDIADEFALLQQELRLMFDNIDRFGVAQHMPSLAAGMRYYELFNRSFDDDLFGEILNVGLAEDDDSLWEDVDDDAE